MMQIASFITACWFYVGIMICVYTGFQLIEISSTAIHNALMKKVRMVSGHEPIGINLISYYLGTVFAVIGMCGLVYLDCMVTTTCFTALPVCFVLVVLFSEILDAFKLQNK